MKIIEDTKSVYQNYGQGTKNHIVTFFISTVIAISGWIAYAIHSTFLVMNGNPRGFSITEATVEFSIAWLASALAIGSSIAINGILQENYRNHNLVHVISTNQEKSF
jgi:hypothetical protein